MHSKTFADAFGAEVSSNVPPTGTVTFLFTDIEGSTQRWERFPVAMREALATHDGMLRVALAAHGGYVFKTVGDAFCAAFARAEDALAAALEAQQALAAGEFSAVEGIGVRMALHTGTADERDGDYFGSTVNRVARLLSIGHAGQVLVSGVTAQLVRTTLPDHAALLDLGERRLKDLARPEHVYQLLAPALAADFPSLRSLDTLPHNLPLMLTSFVGRETEVAEISALLERHRLVTLTGSGGIGKTRTSLQVAANVLDGRRDGVWFVELAPLTNASYIPSAVAFAMGLKLPPQGDAVQHLVHLLHGKSTLIVFDNCEHVLEATAHVISALLHGCEHVAVLASSRQALGISGEAAYRMPSLGIATPAPGEKLSAAVALQSPAVALFVERARAVDQRFEITDDTAPIVAEICRRLDGIALAIELASARVKILSPRLLRDRLDERFRVLTGGNRDVLPRQQTLRALVDWSHDLLDDRERILFRRLGTFVNGFSIEGAVAVAGGDDLDELDVFDLLASLVDKSLVLAEPGRELLRYRLLESTRAYAREKLSAAGEVERCAARQVHFLRDTFAALADAGEQRGRWTELGEMVACELEDVRAALDVALASDAPAGAALLGTIHPGFWESLGLERENVSRSEAYLAALGAGNTIERARLWTAIAHIEGNAGQRARATEAAGEAVTAARAAAVPHVLCASLAQYAFESTRVRRFAEAEAALKEAEALPGLSQARRRSLVATRAGLESLRGNHELAARARELLVREHRALGDEPRARISTLNLAEDVHALGDSRRAIALVDQILPEIRKTADRILLAKALTNISAYHAEAGDLREAALSAREVIRELAPRDPQAPLVASAFEPLAVALAAEGDVERAALLEGYADAVLERASFEREYTERRSHAHVMQLLGAAYAPEELARHLAEGAGLSPETAAALALDERR